MIASPRVRKTALSVAAVSEQGCYDNNALVVGTERAMMTAADEVIFVVDSSKFGHQRLVHLCDLEAIENLVVDNQISQDWRSKLLAHRVKLMVAGPTDNAYGDGIDNMSSATPFDSRLIEQIVTRPACHKEWQTGPGQRRSSRVHGRILCLLQRADDRANRCLARYYARISPSTGSSFFWELVHV